MPVPPISKRFGINIRKHRMAVGLSQERLAEKAGLHATYIGMVERGLRNPTLDVAARIANALGVELPALISESMPASQPSSGPNVDAIRLAALLWHACGRCQICSRTITKHGVELAVDRKIPVDFSSPVEEDNLWVVCEECSRSWQDAWRLGSPIVHAMLNGSARARIRAVLVAKAGVWIPASFLKSVADVEDWAGLIRRLRVSGYEIWFKKKLQTDNETMTYFGLFLREK